MSHATLWISKRLIFIAVLNGLVGCALFEERTGPPSFYGPREQVFLAQFEEVWRAVNRVLEPYPLRVSNMDQGLLETDAIRGYRVWAPPHKSETATSNETYVLTIKVIRGSTTNKNATKVVLVKDSSIKADFFSDPKGVPSDGLEEKQILYRVGREIQIERALAKAQKKINQAQ